MLEKLLPNKFEHLFGGRMYWDTAPDNWTATQREAPFCIMQQVGGVTRAYLDNTTSELLNARVQFFVWGKEKIAVATAMHTLRKALMESNTDTFIVVPEGEAMSDYNEVLKLRGSRRDFSIWYPDPLA